MTTLGSHPQPTGLERRVGADELFFSTTDRRGIIRAGNSVFVRISGYPAADLTGAPHNIIRHPGMPAGAFTLMWNRLLAGKPMAAYVQNLARDGSTYWVFATVTPLGDGFLSVRMAPLTPLYQAARRLYERVREHEAAARAGGMARPQAASYGALELEQGIRALGFDGYQDFMTEALPAEVSARGDLVAAWSARSLGDGPVAAILSAAHDLDRQTSALVSRLDAYRDLSQALSDASRSVLAAVGQLDNAAAAARDGSARIGARAAVLSNVAQVMARPCHDTVTTMRSVAGDIDELRELIAGLRFRIALARLHNDTVAQFAGEVIDGTAPGASLGEVPLLCDALHDGVTDMAAAMRSVNTTLASVNQAVSEAGELFARIRRFAGEWRRLLTRLQPAGSAGLADPVDRLIDDGHAHLAVLRTLAGRCASEIFPFDAAGLDAQLARITSAAALAGAGQ